MLARKAYFSEVIVPKCGRRAIAGGVRWTGNVLSRQPMDDVSELGHAAGQPDDMQVHIGLRR